MHAIPTKYAGVQFRSRLEARWAAMFDLMGWRWEYEPFDLEGWIPDFLVSKRVRVAEYRGGGEEERRWLVEVKSITDFCAQAAGKIERKDHTPIVLLGSFCKLAHWGDEEGEPSCDQLLQVQDIDDFGTMVHVGWEYSWTRGYGCSHHTLDWHDCFIDMGLMGGQTGKKVLGYAHNDIENPAYAGYILRWREAQNRVQWKAPV